MFNFGILSGAFLRYIIYQENRILEEIVDGKSFHLERELISVSNEKNFS